MGICRDFNGRLSYTLTNRRKQVFSVTRGDNRIIIHRPYIRSNAVVVYHDGAFWEDIEKFDSFIKAARFMKENIDHMM